jgi:hypothetical protein
MGKKPEGQQGACASGADRVESIPPTYKVLAQMAMLEAQLALLEAQLMIARSIRSSRAPALPQARWYAEVKSNLQAWREAGGFAAGDALAAHTAPAPSDCDGCTVD